MLLPCYPKRAKTFINHCLCWVWAGAIDAAGGVVAVGRWGICSACLMLLHFKWFRDMGSGWLSLRREGRVIESRALLWSMIVQAQSVGRMVWVWGPGLRRKEERSTYGLSFQCRLRVQVILVYLLAWGCEYPALSASWCWSCAKLRWTPGPQRSLLQSVYIYIYIHIQHDIIWLYKTQRDLGR